MPRASGSGDDRLENLHKEIAMSEATATTDHQAIRDWAEARGGHPARVRGTGGSGVLRIDFDPPEDDLEAITWDEFFEVFDDRRLAFLHQDKTEDGATSRFNKLVNRDTADTG
jgi:hypothetical protein